MLADFISIDPYTLGMGSNTDRGSNTYGFNTYGFNTYGFNTYSRPHTGE